jgi:hypothetical protein
MWVLVGFHPIVPIEPACEIQTSLKTRRIHPGEATQQNKAMSIGTILLILLVLLLLGAFPAWPHSRSWGYAPSGALGLLLVILIILLLLGKV